MLKGNFQLIQDWVTAWTAFSSPHRRSARVAIVTLMLRRGVTAGQVTEVRGGRRQLWPRNSQTGVVSLESKAPGMHLLRHGHLKKSSA